MAKQAVYPFAEELVEAQARANLTAIMLGSLAYARAQGQEGRHWATFIGQAFAFGWTSLTTPHEAAAALALNCASTGMRVESVTGDETRGEVVTGDWPSQQLLASFGLSQAEADQAWSLFEPIAHSLGFSYRWWREGNHLHFIFTR